MSRPAQIGVAVSTFAVLAILCLLMDAPRIQDDIRQRSNDALATAGIVDLALDVSGRDVSLSGTQSQLDRARTALADVDGIRVTNMHPIAIPADSETVVATPPAPTPTPPVPTTSDDMEDRIRDLIDGRPIRFRTGSAQLLPESRTILDELADLLQGTNFDVAIEGHTDATGSAQRNLTLSQERAESVLGYLASRGIDANRMSATGVGSARPIAPNNTAAGRQRNRRIEFNVISRN